MIDIAGGGTTGPDRFSCYGLYGGVLRSELDFPELPPAPAPCADWDLVIGEDAPAPDGLIELGTREVGAESYRLAAFPGGLRLAYSHAGVFDLDVARGAITWYPAPAASAELARAIVIGPVFALLLDARGEFCLHGSAVAAGDGAVAFVGPKHHGKSTLALALTAAGCRLLSDDLVAVRPGEPPTIRPAVPAMRLWRDTVDELRPERLCETMVPGVKNTIGGFPPAAFARQPAPARAIYVLVPIPADDVCGDVERQRITGAEAVVALAHQKKLADSLVGLDVAGSRLRLAAATAAAVPVYELHVRRDFSALPRVVQQILDWHGGVPAESIRHGERE